jgi:hypothetical protein
MAVLNRDLYFSVGALNETAEKINGVYVVFIKADALVLVDSANECLGAERNGRVKQGEIFFSLFGQNDSVRLNVVIPSADTGNIKSRSGLLIQNKLTVGAKGIRLGFVVAAILNKFEPLSLDLVKARVGAVVLYSSYSHNFPPNYRSL